MSNEESYTIEEHFHRFAYWAAARAVRGMSVVRAKDLLQRRRFSADLSARRCFTSQREFDEAHRRWRKDFVKSDPQVTHGTAAKLINVYMKARCLGRGRSDVDRYLHPPIDRYLLTNLRAKCGRSDFIPRGPWTEFNSCDYEQAISAIKKIQGEQPLWKIEALWRPERPTNSADE